ncbi:MAG: hypothetical protein IIB27_02235 [Chloroflexi bacterium]|nr:hypothetical protein [Chloroflexota bacterium]
MSEHRASPSDRIFSRKPYGAIFLSGLILAAIACGSDVGPTSSGEPRTGILATTIVEPSLTIPDGWSRTQVRDGLLGRHTATPLVGFTIDLPPDWKAGESWARGDILEGWIAAPPNALVDWWPTFWYRIGADPQDEVQALKEDPRYEITELELNGVKVAVRVAAPEATRGTQFGAYYEQIPGAPDGMIAPSLDIDGDSRGFDDQKLLGQILKSVRYSELSSLPERPVAEAIDTSDWVYSLARTDLQNSQWGAANFSLLLPPGWTTTEAWSIDSAIGTISGDGIELSYDYLGGVIDPHDPRAIADGLPGHNVWDEEVDGVLFSFIRPDSQEPDPRGTTGASITIPAFRDDGSSGAVRLPISGAGLDADQQELALAVLRTIRGVPYESAE